MNNPEFKVAQASRGLNFQSARAVQESTSQSNNFSVSNLNHDLFMRQQNPEFKVTQASRGLNF